MAKFCAKCGSKLDETTGCCPKCDSNNNLSNQKKKKYKLKNVCAILILISVGIILYHFHIIEIPFISNLKEKDGNESQKIYQDKFTDDINYENYRIDPIDADEYFQEISEIKNIITIEESEHLLTEAQVVKLLTDIGIDKYPITTEYDINGKYHEAVEITGSSDEKHPVYDTYYISQSNEMWSISIVENKIKAVPISYNLQSGIKSELIFSEFKTINCYDSAKNQFYVIIPQKEVMDVKIVDTINAEILEKYSIEVLNSL